MFPKETTRHHRIKKIIIGIIIIPIALFLVLIIISFVSNVFYRSTNIQQGNYSIFQKTTTPTATPTNLYDKKKQALIEGLGNQTLGSKNPKLTIVQFADFACPYCKTSYANLRELILLYQDDVKLVFRDWPGHSNSLSLALAAHCAGEQNKFWEMHDQLYLNQTATFGAEKNDLANLVFELGIYNQQFQNCFDSQKYLSRIQKNVIDAETLGVKGTPTWFFNGNKIEGELTKSDLEKIIKDYVK